MVNINKNFVYSSDKRGGYSGAKHPITSLVPLRKIKTINPRKFFRLYKVAEKFQKYVKKRASRLHRRYLRRAGRKLFYYFIKKFKVYKHKFLLKKFFYKYRILWAPRARKGRPYIVGLRFIKVPRILLRKSRKGSVKLSRSLSLLLKAARSNYNSATLGYNFAPRVKSVITNNSENALVIVNSLKKNSIRLNLLQSELSGFRLIKYISLFSRKGNYGRLFNLFFNRYSINRFEVFNTISNLFFVVSKRLLSNPVNDLILFSPLSITRRLSIAQSKVRLSLVCRRFFFKYSTKVNLLSSLYKHRLSVKGLNSRLSGSFVLLSLRLFNKFLSLFKVYVEVKPWKKSGRAVTVPVPIKSKARRSFIFAHWFKESILSRTNRGGFGLNVFTGFQDLSRLEGDAIKQLNNLSKTVQSNRALIRKSGMRIV